MCCEGLDNVKKNACYLLSIEVPGGALAPALVEVEPEEH
jgi:hypothetical protein